MFILARLAGFLVPIIAAVPEFKTFSHSQVSIKSKPPRFNSINPASPATGF